MLFVHEYCVWRRKFHDHASTGLATLEKWRPKCRNVLRRTWKTSFDNCSQGSLVLTVFGFLPLVELSSYLLDLMRTSDHSNMYLAMTVVSSFWKELHCICARIVQIVDEFLTNNKMKDDCFKTSSVCLCRGLSNFMNFWIVTIDVITMKWNDQAQINMSIEVKWNFSSVHGKLHSHLYTTSEPGVSPN